MTLLREVVLPVGLASAGVLLVLLGAARRPAPRLRSGRAAWPDLLRHLATSTVGGVAVLMAAMTVYCATRGVAFGGCIIEPVRGVGVLLAVAVPGLVAIEAVARLKR